MCKILLVIQLLCLLCCSEGLPVCKHSIYMGPGYSTGIRIEPFEPSYVHLDFNEKFRDGAESRKNISFRFEFKTASASGTLFYTRRKENDWQSLALVIEEGYLHCKTSSSVMQTSSILNTASRVDDGEWHSVVIRFSGGYSKENYVTVDNTPYTIDYWTGLDRISSLVFGGIRPVDKNDINRLLDLSPQVLQYEGCLREGFFSYLLIDYPKHYNVSPCK